MYGCGLHSDTYTYTRVMIVLFDSNNDTQRIVALFEMHRALGVTLNTRICNIYLASLSRQVKADYHTALTVYNRMLQGQYGADVHVDMHTYFAVLTVLSNAKQVTKACTLFEQLKTHVNNNTIHNSSIDNDGIDDPRFLSTHTPALNTTLYNIIIRACGVGGDLHQASHYFDEMVTSGLTPDAVTFLSLINACIHASMPHRALIVYKQMTDTYDKQPDVRALTSIMTAYRHMKRYDDALTIFTQIVSTNSNNVDVVLLTEASVCALAANNADAASTILRLAVKTNKGHNIRDDITPIVNHVLSTYVSSKQYDAAVDLYNTHALYTNATSLSIILSCFIRLKQYDNVIALAENTTSSKNIESCKYILLAYIHKHEYAKCYTHAFPHMLNCSYRSSATTLPSTCSTPSLSIRTANTHIAACMDMLLLSSYHSQSLHLHLPHYINFFTQDGDVRSRHTLTEQNELYTSLQQHSIEVINRMHDERMKRIEHYYMNDDVSTHHQHTTHTSDEDEWWSGSNEVADTTHTTSTSSSTARVTAGLAFVHVASRVLLSVSRTPLLSSTLSSTLSRCMHQLLHNCIYYSILPITSQPLTAFVSTRRIHFSNTYTIDLTHVSTLSANEETMIDTLLHMLTYFNTAEHVLIDVQIRCSTPSVAQCVSRYLSSSHNITSSSASNAVLHIAAGSIRSFV